MTSQHNITLTLTQTIKRVLNLGHEPLTKKAFYGLYISCLDLGRSKIDRILILIKLRVRLNVVGFVCATYLHGKYFKILGVIIE